MNASTTINVQNVPYTWLGKKNLRIIVYPYMPVQYSGIARQGTARASSHAALPSAPKTN